MKNYFYAIWLTSILIMPISTVHASDSAIGYIKNITSTALVSHQGKGLLVKLVVGDPIYLNDVITTNATGTVGMTFIDGTIMSLGENTEMIMESYLFNPKTNSFSFISKITSGAMQYISGAIGKLAPKSVTVKTPTGLIGVRGTRFVMKVE